MSLVESKRSPKQNPPSIQHIQEQIRSTCEDIIHFCLAETASTFYQTEQALQVKISTLACLFLQLFLMSFQEQFDYSSWLEEGKHYQGNLVSRTIKTIYGDVRYWRHYLVRKGGGGFYPLDSLPYTIFLLNGDMELNRYRKPFVQKMLKELQP